MGGPTGMGALSCRTLSKIVNYYKQLKLGWESWICTFFCGRLIDSFNAAEGVE
jgi:hypothetical protein